MGEEELSPHIEKKGVRQIGGWRQGGDRVVIQL